MLKDMFELRRDFMNRIRKKDEKSYPDWPVDVKKRKNQQALRETTLRGVEELFEALQHLKNWKTHRTDSSDFDFNREEFLEEMVDALNYFFAVLVMLGIDELELYSAYFKKHKKILGRLENNIKN